MSIICDKLDWVFYLLYVDYTYSSKLDNSIFNIIIDDYHYGCTDFFHSWVNFQIEKLFLKHVLLKFVEPTEKWF